MKIIKNVSLIFVIILISSISYAQTGTALKINSPMKKNIVEFNLSKNGCPYYMVAHNGIKVIDSSFMSFDFKNQSPLKSSLKILNSTTSSLSEIWEMPWGEQRKVKNNYNELVVELEEIYKPNRRFNIYFRAYDDGVAFRYEFLGQQGLDSVIIMEENTDFQLTADHTAWWIPADWDSYEYLYQTTLLSEMDSIKQKNTQRMGHNAIKDNAVHTPFTMRTKEGIHLSIHEADLVDYSSMTLKVESSSFKLTSQLVGSGRLGYKVKRALPFKTPWRTIQIADKATDLIASNLIVNLNEPNKIEDVSWFKPMKYMGIWWEMHLGKGSWDYGMKKDEKAGKWVDLGKAHGRHSANTENAKRYIDFASKNGIKGLLVEGWNTGWEHWIGFDDREGVFDFVTPYPDYNITEVVQYGKKKGVEIIMHHETSAAVETYGLQMDTAYRLMKNLGLHVVKSGYVGKIIPKGEYHHGQWMVNQYQRALEKAAKYQIAVDAHEPIKATGLRRTFPNAISREGLRGQEYNAWANDGGNPPEHLTIIAFTAMLAGPVDYTPGVFDLTLPTKKNNQINTTLAQQLALFVVLYSPIQMACDLPENYENQPAFEFIRAVGVDWEQTNVLDGEVGDYVVIAREEKETKNWFIGGITDENKRKYNINFDFLDDKKKYLATFYMDAENSDYKTNPTAVKIEQAVITKGFNKELIMKEGGGFAVSLIVQ